jgi:hypothetical protein
MKILLAGASRSWRLPVTFVALALASGLLVDSYRAWALNHAEPNCQSRFALLYIAHPRTIRSGERIEQEAVHAWEEQVSRKYGARFAIFIHAKERQAGVQQCYPNLDGGPRQCAYASGQPCLR